MPDITLQAQEYTEKKEAEEAARPKSKFTQEQLMNTLIWCWDGFDRAGILFFLIFDTAKQVMKRQPLPGDGLDVGVRRLEWESGSKPILDAFLDHHGISENKEGNIVTYIYNDIPVRVHIFEDNECISNCDTVVYEMEHFKVPNPYSKFEELYG